MKNLRPLFSILVALLLVVVAGLVFLSSSSAQTERVDGLEMAEVFGNISEFDGASHCFVLSLLFSSFLSSMMNSHDGIPRRALRTA